ncbi:hypothetical protein LJ707_11060 [Mucilaginibacter sp. UR6-1]|uniref:hypothetical protein n=1 Tax=Mucilaginibacter sp. UR6-1 TaxID=1435643 RepID=UPI001E3B524E|nr:hypothetical protein [Mucilaginibacter sp. UR6-1]MCC8409472.1 hypothetical protein [Mucilaginibacter sp. UR6-1]
MRVQWSSKKDEFNLPDFIPNELLNEERAINNLGRCLKTIDEAGGMRIDEIVCNILGLSSEVRLVMNDNTFADLLKNYLRLKGLLNTKSN